MKREEESVVNPCETAVVLIESQSRSQTMAEKRSRA